MPWGLRQVLSIRQVLSPRAGCVGPPPSPLCLSLCVSLGRLWVSVPHLVHHVSLRGAAPVSESAVRCSVYLKGSSWSALSHSNPPTSPHTLECISARPAPPPRQQPSDPTFCNHHKLLVQIGCCFKCENNCSKAIKPE